MKIALGMFDDDWLERLLSERQELQAAFEAVLNCREPGPWQKLFDGFIGEAQEAWIKMAACHALALKSGVRLEMPDNLRGWLDDICRGYLSPALIGSASVGDDLFAVAKRLPMIDQKHIASNQPIKFLLADGDHRMVEPATMTREQIRQAIGPKGIRSLDEQRAYLAERSAVKKEADPDTPWVVQRRPVKCIVVRKDTPLTPAMLRRALRDLGEDLTDEGPA